MRISLATPSIATAFLMSLPSVAIAQVTISTDTTSPLSTSTANSGSASDIIVSEDGTITLDSGATITVDSDNDVTNDGTLSLGGANGATAINVTPGRLANIISNGTITVTEDFIALNEDDNTIVDGPIAQATGRAAIRVGNGGPLTGNITNAGTITVEGLNSAGILVEDELVGSLASSGAITVLGDYSTGIHAGDISGNVEIDGAIAVIGEGAVALNLTGDIGGAVRLQSTISQATFYVDDDEATKILARSDLRVAAPAVAISGNVAGGIIIARPPTTSSDDTDVDDDGILDTEEGAGLLQAYGNGAALRIGSGSDIIIAPVADDTHALVIEGSILTKAYYSRTDAQALVIGGQGGAVDIQGGIVNSGSIYATTLDSAATAILINAGATVPVIDNSGTISAIINSSGEGAVYGIRDLSGTLTTINTNGTISSNGSSTDIAYAIDLSANSSGVTINQYSPPDEDEDSEALITTQITGNIRTGSGNDLLSVSDGLVKGNSFFGDGADVVQLSGDAIYQGKINFGNGVGTLSLADSSLFLGTANFDNQNASLTITDEAVFSGLISGGASLHVTLNGGTFEASGTEDLSFNALTVNSGGTLKFALDAEDHSSIKLDVASVSFSEGAHIAASVSSLLNAEGHYLVLTAGQITGEPDFADDQTDLPFLFKGSVSINETLGEVSLDIARKTSTELNLNRSQTSAYDAILAAAPTDASIEASLLEITDSDTLKDQFNGLLPDHTGGNIDLLVQGSRLATRHLTNNNTIFGVDHKGGWLEALKWGGSGGSSNTASYKTGGWGLSGGIERITTIGYFGGSFSWLNGSNENSSADGSISSSAYQLGAFWRMSNGPFYAFAHASYGFASFKSDRTFTGLASETEFTRSASADWNGHLLSGTAGASYQIDLGYQLAIKPMVIIDYYRLSEDGYTEIDGGDAVNLTVAGRTSSVATAMTTVTGIYRLGSRSKANIPLTFELEAGRRSVLGGRSGTTIANFTDGEQFSLTADGLQGGWLGELRLLFGGMDYTWTASAAVEETQGGSAYSARISFGAAF